MIEKLRHIAVLPVIAAALVAAGCGGKTSLSREELVAAAFDDLRLQIEQVIVDSGRETATLKIADRLERDFDALYDSVVERRSRVRALHADYDVTREALVALTDQLEATMRDARANVTATHRELVAATTAEEWAAIAKADTKTMKAAIDALQAI